MASNPQKRYSLKEYFEIEKKSDIKHEFIYGEVFLMTGASRRHNLIAFNISGLLHPQLRNTTCEGYIADMRTKINDQVYRYPDVVVACNPRLEIVDGLQTLTNPILVVEILSPSTARFDRDAKFREYQQIDSLRYYLLVSQTETNATLISKQDDSSWASVNFTGFNEIIELPLINSRLLINDIYDKVFNIN